MGAPSFFASPFVLPLLNAPGTAVVYSPAPAPAPEAECERTSAAGPGARAQTPPGFHAHLIMPSTGHAGHKKRAAEDDEDEDEETAVPPLPKRARAELDKMDVRFAKNMKMEINEVVEMELMDVEMDL